MASRKSTSDQQDEVACHPGYEISERVARQASVRPYQRDPRAPLVRPLRIYTLDPSVSDRLGGIATVNVPYEKLEPGPDRVALRGRRATARPAARSGPSRSTSTIRTCCCRADCRRRRRTARFHLQMVYAVCSLTYAAFRRALGRDIAWAINGDRPTGRCGSSCGRSASAAATPATAAKPATCRSATSAPATKPAGFTLKGGLICTALSHDIIAHETTHALLDGLRSSFLDPTNVDVPAFHEGFADLVALFLHFTYADVVEQAIRDPAARSRTDRC